MSSIELAWSIVTSDLRQPGAAHGSGFTLSGATASALHRGASVPAFSRSAASPEYHNSAGDDQRGVQSGVARRRQPAPLRWNRRQPQRSDTGTIVPAHLVKAQFFRSYIFP